MEENIIIPNSSDIAMLKQKTLPYLPHNLGEVKAQQQILKMVADVVPEVAANIEQINRLIWTKVETGELKINHGVTQCAYEADRIIGSVSLNALMHNAFSEETLMRAWIALDYYAYVLKAGYSDNIRRLQNRITEVLLMGTSDSNADVSGAAYPEIPVEDVETSAIPASVYQQMNSCQTDVQNQISDTEIAQIEKELAAEKPPVKKKRKNKKMLVILVAVVMAVLAVVAYLNTATQKTKAAISRIGVVTLESEEHILQAEQLYNALDEDQQAKINNSDALFAARAEYDCLVAETAIDAIGKVTLESKEAVVHAEQLYEALSRESRNLVGNYKTLTAARKEYDRLDAAVKKAETTIDAIGEVTLESGKKIEEARKAYDALKKDDLQKHLTKKASLLTNAEKEYKNLNGKNLYDTGMSYYNNKDYEKAVESFNAVITDYADTEFKKEAEKSKADSQIALAKQALDKKDYYTVKKTLDAVTKEYQQQDNYKKLHEDFLAALKKARPKNVSTIDGKLGSGQCYIKVTAGNQDVCVKAQKISDPTKFKMIYVHAGKKATIKLGDGKYTIKWATGEHWYGKKYLFGDEGSYKSISPVNFDTTYGGGYVYYQWVDLNLPNLKFSSDTITLNEF